MDGFEGRRLAAELVGLAETVRRAATRAAAAEGVHWRSVAADRFREALAAEARRAHRSADLLDDAGRAVVAHLQAVQAVQAVQTRAAEGPVR